MDHANINPEFTAYRFSQTEIAWAVFLCIGSVYVTLLAMIPELRQFGWACPWDKYLKVECLGCGFTRACIATTRLDWRSAIQLNPLAPHIFIFIGWRAVVLAVGLTTRVDLMQRLPKWGRKAYIYSFLGVAIPLLVYRLTVGVGGWFGFFQG